jgi:nucleoside 2-deoxyribosyltransferase
VKIYVAGPLFNDMERERNLQVERWLRRRGFDVHLPQKHGLVAELALRASPRAVRRRVFESDVAALRECDVVLCLLDGPVPDDGMCVELGMAWALGKQCVGYRTDVRRHGRTGDVNPMIEGCLAGIARTRGELAGLLSEAAATASGGGRRPPAPRRTRAASRRRPAPRRR